MKKQKKIILAAICLAGLCAGLMLLYQKAAPKGVEGAKTITVTVVYEEKEKKEYVYHTDESYLGEVLKEHDLIEGEEGEYGLFITSVGGKKADETKQQWWCITKGGEQVNTSADATAISDQDQFEITLTEGY